MKNISKVLLASAMLLGIAGCSGNGGGSSAEDPTKKSEGVMTYAEFDAAKVDEEVTIETYVQAKQSWWDGKANLYTQDGDGGYFIYEMAMTEDEFNKLTKGTKIKVTGFKAEWAGEVEVTEGKFEIEEGSWTATPEDVTALLGTDDMIKKMNKLVSFKDMTVEKAYTYKWDGSGSEGDDLYFDVSSNGKTYTFTVESYLCDKDSDVYKAVKELKEGDKVDMEGFAYWYEGLNPHITSVTKK